MWKCEQRKKFILRYFSTAPAGSLGNEVCNGPSDTLRHLAHREKHHRQLFSSAQPRRNQPAEVLLALRGVRPRLQPREEWGARAPTRGGHPGAEEQGRGPGPLSARPAGPAARGGRSPSASGEPHPLSRPRLGAPTSRGVPAARPPHRQNFPQLSCRPGAHLSAGGARARAGASPARCRPRRSPFLPRPPARLAGACRCLSAPCGPRRPPPPDSSAALDGRPSGTRFCGVRLERRQPPHPCPAPPGKDEGRNRTAGEGRTTSTSYSSRWPEVGGSSHLRRARLAPARRERPGIGCRYREGRGNFAYDEVLPQKGHSETSESCCQECLTGTTRETASPRERAVLCRPRSSGCPGQVPRCPPAPVVPRSAQRRPQRLGGRCPSHRRPGCRPRTAPAGLGSRLPTSAGLGWASRR